MQLFQPNLHSACGGSGLVNSISSFELLLFSLIYLLVTRHAVPLPVLTSWSRGKFIALPLNVTSLPNPEGSSSSRQLESGEGSSNLRRSSVKRKRAPTPPSSDVDIIFVNSSPVAQPPARKRVSRGKGKFLPSKVVSLFTKTNISSRQIC